MRRASLIAFALIFVAGARARGGHARRRHAPDGSRRVRLREDRRHDSFRRRSPAIRATRRVVDLDKAPRNAAGRVEFSSDLYILRPKAPRGNGAALVDILNRGNKVVLNGFNRGGSPDPATENDLGDRFLMRFGFTDRLGRLGIRRRRPADGDAHPRAGGDRARPADHRHRPRDVHGQRGGEGIRGHRPGAIRRRPIRRGPTASSPRARRCSAPRSRCRAANGRSAGHTVTLDSGFVPRHAPTKSAIAPPIRRSPAWATSRSATRPRG